MKILYLSPNMAQYGGAQYQHDVMQELARQAEVFFYGPGFRAYDAADTLADALRKSPFPSGPDLILVGHAWLEDKPGAPVEKFPHIDLGATRLPRAAILNKEYTNLAAKLAWIERVSASTVFTHHHDAASFQARTGIPFVFWPFAADHRLFHPPTEPKTFDLGFSGILQNPTPGMQTDLRVRIMERLFECERDIPQRPREWSRSLRFYFNGLPRDPADRALAEARGTYKRLDTPQYAAKVRACRAFLCTRSPADLVSPRYFECMLSRTLVLAEHNPAHAAVFPPGSFIEFGDEDAFQASLLAALDSPATPAMLDFAQRHAQAHHTWQVRIRAMLNALSQMLSGAAPARHESAA